MNNVCIYCNANIIHTIMIHMQHGTTPTSFMPIWLYANIILSSIILANTIHANIIHANIIHMQQDTTSFMPIRFYANMIHANMIIWQHHSCHHDSHAIWFYANMILYQYHSCQLIAMPRWFYANLILSQHDSCQQNFMQLQHWNGVGNIKFAYSPVGINHCIIFIPNY